MRAALESDPLGDYLLRTGRPRGAREHTARQRAVRHSSTRRSGDRYAGSRGSRQQRVACSGTVRGGDGQGSVGVEREVPAMLVSQVVMARAHGNEVVKVGASACGPVDHVMHFALPERRIAAGECTGGVHGTQRVALGSACETRGAAKVECDTVTAEHHRDDVGVARKAPCGVGRKPHPRFVFAYGFVVQAADECAVVDMHNNVSTARTTRTTSIASIARGVSVAAAAGEVGECFGSEVVSADGAGGDLCGGEIAGWGFCRWRVA